MYTSWKHLAIKDENELRNLARLKRIPRARGSMSIPVLILFGLGAAVSFALAVFFAFLGLTGGMTPFGSLGAVFAMFVLGVFFVIAIKLYREERYLDLVRRYLLQPLDFDFVEGTLESFTFQRDDSRRSGRIMVKGHAFAKSGQEMLAMEQFSPYIWPFTTEEEDARLQPHDDWYDLKGKRLKLPIKAYFIYEKANPQVGALVGVPEEIVREALQKAELAD